jgi:hypothetical protein
MTSIRIAIVSALALAALLAGGARAEHAAVHHVTTVAASVKPAGEACCDE